MAVVQILFCSKWLARKKKLLKLKMSLVATVMGLWAIILWSFIAVLVAASGQVPPFELTALSFGLAGCLGVVTWIFRPGVVASLRQPSWIWAFGIGSFFSYHALYFIALKLAPPIEAALVNYLWPLFIILLSANLPGREIKGIHIFGAALGFAGAAVLFGEQSAMGFNQGHLPGLAAAFAAACVWAIYSVVSHRLPNVPTDTVIIYYLGTAFLAGIFHFMFEVTVFPTKAEWGGVICIGIAPAGLAYYCWDFGIKRGNFRALAVASYCAPLLSAFFLVVAGYSELSFSLLFATLLIAAGSFVAARGRAS